MHLLEVVWQGTRKGWPDSYFASLSTQADRISRFWRGLPTAVLNAWRRSHGLAAMASSILDTEAESGYEVHHGNQ